MTLTPTIAKYRVLVDDNFHYMDDDARWTAGEFDTAEAALAKCRATSSESFEEFEALYMRRRRFYPPDDPIIDRLVEKITLAYLRIDRGFEAEAEILQQGSLAELLVHCNKPIKNLTGYEAGNRKALKVLEEELARYVSMLNETCDLQSMTSEPTTGRLEEMDVAATRPPANDAAAAPPTPSSPTPTKDRDRNAKPKTAKASEPSTREEPPASAIKPIAPPPAETPPIRENPKTKPISAEGSGQPASATSATEAAATPSASPAAPPPLPAVPLAPPTMQPQAPNQTNFDILNWGARRRGDRQYMVAQRKRPIWAFAAPPSQSRDRVNFFRIASVVTIGMPDPSAA